MPPRREVLANQALEAPAAGAHELLKQRCMPMPRADEIEVQTDVAQQYFARGPRPVEHLQGLAVELFKVVFEHGQVELFLALEVIIEQRFVDAGLGGNEIRASASQAGLGEHPFGGGQNGSPCTDTRRAPARAGLSVHTFAHKLINRIVNLVQPFCQMEPSGGRAGSPLHAAARAYSRPGAQRTGRPTRHD